MPDPSNPELPANLLANTAWMHALARQLVEGEDGAEDLVQETWLRVLRRGPRDPGRARGWLATVLRNVSVSNARAEGRRAARERDVAPGERIESTADVIERVASHQEVVDAVMALEEPCRRMILMRYFDGLPPREIARREGTPADTVKGRLARGLELLRRALDASHGGDRRAWVGLLVPLARCGEVGGAGWPTGLGLAVKVIAAVAVPILFVTAIFHFNAAPKSTAVPETGEAWKEGPPEDAVRVPVEVEAITPPEDPPPIGPGVVENAGASGKEIEPRVVQLDPPPLAGEWWLGEGPPGLVRIPGGVTQVGTDAGDLIKMFEENPQLLKNDAAFLAEVPRHEVDVDDFYLMVTEVTNEQYEVYVRAMGVRPPHSWGEKAITEARDRYLREQGELRKVAIEQGRKPVLRVPFDAPDWWAANWKDAYWEVTEELKKVPVVFVDYQDARGYAEWAGLRLVDENEFERAVRGDTDRPFPWGANWIAGQLAATSGMRGVSEIFPVGSFPAGASEQGVFDLAGNVWEWTRSKFMPYPDWRHKKYEVGQGRERREIDAIPSWSPDRRVIKGGSKQNSHFYARCTTRGGFDRYQKASALGFRCAASIQPGVDFARTCLEEIPRELRPLTEDGPVVFEPRETVALQRWHRMLLPDGPPGYEVITGCEYVLFMPAEQIPVNGLDDIRQATSTDDLVYLGVLSTNQEIAEPELPPGTYLVALRGRGPVPERPSPDEDETTRLLVDQHLQLDVAVDNLVLIDMAGKPVAALPTDRISYENPTHSTLNVVDRTGLVPAEGEEGSAHPRQVVRTQRWLDLDLFVRGNSRQGLRVFLSLRFEE